MPETGIGRAIRTPLLLWALSFLALVLVVVFRLDAYVLGATIESGRFIDGFVAVDHPFHTMRAYQLIESLRDGQPLRWMMQHQGGYPVEFYPLGVGYIEAVIWALSFGSLSIFAVHTLTIVLVFLLPGVAYWMLARGDRRDPAVGLLAFGLHIAISGYWMSGGFRESVSWGLVTNATGAAAALIATAGLARFVIRGQAAMGLVATSAIGLAVYANPRSLIAVAVAAIAVGLSALLAGVPIRSIVIRLGTVAIIAGCIGATELATLIRYNDLYYFVNYESYTADKTYWNATVQSVSAPVIWLAMGGAIWAMISPRYVVARSVAIALALYVLLTLFLSGTFGDFDVIQQLEAPRLMPYQRFVMLYLAAFFVVRAIDMVAAALHVRKKRGFGVAIVTAMVLVMFLRPIGNVSDNFASMPESPQMPTQELDAFRQAIADADAAAPEGTGILVLGTMNIFPGNWHERLWATLETERPLYYEQWLWGWNDRHEGPPALEDGRCTFDNDDGNYYPCPGRTLTDEYLSDHGIGAVVVTENASNYESVPRASEDASASPLLTPLGSYRSWDVYSVNAVATIATDGTVNASSIEIDDHRIQATFDDGDGQILVRVNWFPRWQATVNGEAVGVSRAEGGYMRISAPAGPVDLELTYERTALDQLTRVLGWLGTIGALAIVPVMRRLAGPNA